MLGACKTRGVDLAHFEREGRVVPREGADGSREAEIFVSIAMPRLHGESCRHFVGTHALASTEPSPCAEATPCLAYTRRFGMVWWEQRGSGGATVSSH